MQDLLYVTGGTVYELISNGSTFSAAQIYSGSAPNPSPIHYNGDGCTDYIIGSTIYVSACNGTAATSIPIPSPYQFVTAIDWNGDGLQDLLVTDNSNLYVCLSTGNGISGPNPTGIPYSSSVETYQAADLNGDGLDDLIAWASTGTYYLHNGVAEPPDLLIGAADTYGNSVAPTYIALAQGDYQEASDAAYPDQDYIGAMYVVNRAVFSDPSTSGATYYQTYTYYGAWTNLIGRGFDGFAETTTYDSRTSPFGNFNESKYFERRFPYTGMLYQDVLSTGTATIRELSITPGLTTLDNTTNNQRYFPYTARQQLQNWELGGSENGDLITTTNTTYGFDNYGNPTSIVATVTDNDPGSPYNGQSWTTSTAYSPDVDINEANDLPEWCIALNDETQVTYSSTLSGSNGVTRTRTYTPDTPEYCRILTTTTEPNSTPYKVVESYTYDGFGNVSIDSVTGGNMPASPATRTTQMGWGTTGQFMISQTDPSGASTQWNYASQQALAFGVPDNMTDANGLETQWTYDSFGRKATEVRPDGTSTAWGWSTCSSFCGWSNSAYEVTQTQEDSSHRSIRVDTTLYDPVDRVTESSGPNVSGSNVTVEQTYNSMGMLAQKSLPFVSGNTVYEQTYTYDGLNRLIEESSPENAANPSVIEHTSYGYAGRTTTTTDRLGNTSTIVSDVNGWLREAKDAVGYTVTTAYDAAGSKTLVTDSQGKTLWQSATTGNPYCYVYGIRPFLTCATDKDLGAWTYTIDSLGEITNWTDAKGQAFSETYDALSRPLSRSEPDPLVTQWTWGSTPANHNVGQLIGECTGTAMGTSAPCTTLGVSPLYSEARTYDGDGRLSTRAITLAGDSGNDNGAFLYTYTYNSATGLPYTLTYPTSTAGYALTIQYGYGYGMLQSITDTSDPVGTCGTSCTLWTASVSSSSTLTQTQETLGNGVVVSRGYDAVTGLLARATAGIGAGTAVLNQSYLEDADGNVTQRQDNNAGLTENFWYDIDNRVTCAALTSTCPSPTIAYDGGSAGPGNITSKIDSAGTLASYSVDWTSYNYPSSITAGAESVQFSYGPDRQRWQQVYGDDGATETTYYIGGLMDEVYGEGIVDYRHYIYAGDSPVAIYSRKSTLVNTYSYLVADHQGSIASITNSSGSTLVDESFTPYGNRRNPSTWSGAASSADLTTSAGVTRQGYTFQTTLGQAMGLNHMNGRVQDAVSGRFLSPDPMIQDPSNVQGYNRYSYVVNNPLTFLDSTGFDCGTDYMESCPTVSADLSSPLSQCPMLFSMECSDPSVTAYTSFGEYSGFAGWSPASIPGLLALQGDSFNPNGAGFELYTLTFPNGQTLTAGQVNQQCAAGCDAPTYATLTYYSVGPLSSEPFFNIPNPLLNIAIPGVSMGTQQALSPRPTSPRKACTFTAEYSAVGPNQATGIGALGIVPPSNSVAVNPGTFGLPYTTYAQRVSSQAALRENIPFITIYAPGLSQYMTGSTTFTIGDVGDANIRSSPGPRFDIYGWATKQDALEFGKRYAVTTITGVPRSWTCP